MKQLYLFISPILVTCFIGKTPVSAQNIATDSSNNQVAFYKAVSFYHQSLKPEAGLYNGIQYRPYDQTLKEGHPYFEYPIPVEGSVVYNNMLYEHLALQFDIVIEKLILTEPTHSYTIQLNNDRLAGFTLQNHHFIRLNGDSLEDAGLKAGFYELLYDGKTKLYKKQVKNIQEKLTTEVEKYISEATDYYVYKNGKYYAANQKSSLLKVLADHKKEVSQFIRKNKIKIRKNQDSSLAQVLGFYDQVTP